MLALWYIWWTVNSSVNVTRVVEQSKIHRCQNDSSSCDHESLSWHFQDPVLESDRLTAHHQRFTSCELQQRLIHLEKQQRQRPNHDFLWFNSDLRSVCLFTVQRSHSASLSSNRTHRRRRSAPCDDWQLSHSGVSTRTRFSAFTLEFLWTELSLSKFSLLVSLKPERPHVLFWRCGRLSVTFLFFLTYSETVCA